MGRLFLIRHGETDSNREKRLLGSTDMGLSKSGKNQSELLAGWFRAENLSALYSSPMRRCVETISPLANISGKEILEVPELKEMDFGEWEGRRVADISSQYPELSKRWLIDPSKAQIPGGEGLYDFRDRVIKCMNEIIGLHNPKEDLLIVTHGGPIRIALCLVLGIDIGRLLRLEVDFASITVVKFFGSGIEDSVSVSRLNNTCHLYPVMPRRHSPEEGEEP